MPSLVGPQEAHTFLQNFLWANFTATPSVSEHVRQSSPVTDAWLELMTLTHKSLSESDLASLWSASSLLALMTESLSPMLPGSSNTKTSLKSASHLAGMEGIDELESRWDRALASCWHSITAPGFGLGSVATQAVPVQDCTCCHSWHPWYQQEALTLCHLWWKLIQHGHWIDGFHHQWTLSWFQCEPSCHVGCQLHCLRNDHTSWAWYQQWVRGMGTWLECWRLQCHTCGRPEETEWKPEVLGCLLAQEKATDWEALELLSPGVMSAKASSLSCMAAASASPMEHVGAVPGLSTVERNQLSSFTGSAGSHLSRGLPWT